MKRVYSWFRVNKYAVQPTAKAQTRPAITLLTIKFYFMQLEQLERGKHIQEKLQVLREHLKWLAQVWIDAAAARGVASVDRTGAAIPASSNTYRDEFTLYKDFYDKNEHLLLYRAEIEKRILALEGEFAAL